MEWKIYLIFLLPIISFVVQLSFVKIEPTDFTCTHRKQIKGDPYNLFQFLISPHVLERLLPWLTRFKESDKRIISAGKSYSAIIEIPILGERKVHAVLTEYKPSKLLVFEFSNDYVEQKIIIQARNYHDRTLLQATVYSRRTSFLYQHTIGYIFRWYVKNQLEKSMKIVAEMVESLHGPDVIPDFSRSNHFN